MEMISESPQQLAAQLAERLLAWFSSDCRYVVALSGGVDSAVVACAAIKAKVQVIAATGIGPATSQIERQDAIHLVQSLGLAHEWVEPAEYLDQAYRRNDLRRCYYCKTHLFRALKVRFPDAIVLTGTNLDDLGDFRPGLQAASEAHVRSPLAELKINKAQIRLLAKMWDLHVADKPASPCLASRIAYGVEVTPERLSRIEAAERYLRQELGVSDCRVRVHADELARIEVPRSHLQQLLESQSFQAIDQFLRSLGFRHVTLDLGGLKSGSLNPSIPAETLTQITHQV